MLRKILSSRVFHLTVVACAAFGVIFTIFPGEIGPFNRLVNYATQLMLLYLFAGIVFLILKQPRLTFVFFSGSLLLSLYLKYSMKDNSIEHWRLTLTRKNHAGQDEAVRSDTLKIIHLDLSLIKNPGNLLILEHKTQADVLTFQRVTTEWVEWLSDSISADFPYYNVVADTGLFGMAIFSRWPVENWDTFYFGQIPGLKGILNKGSTRIHLFSVLTKPASNASSQRHLKAHLDFVTALIGETKEPVFIIGDFNAVFWSGEIQSFLNNTGLFQSRSGFMDVRPPEIPLNHIFFSRHLQCIRFETLSGQGDGLIGIEGTYQFVHANVEKSDQ